MAESLERRKMLRELIKTCFFSFTRINTLIHTSFRVPLGGGILGRKMEDSGSYRKKYCSPL